MVLYNFLICKRVLPSRVTQDRCLVNCDAWGCFSGDLRSGHLMISGEGLSWEKGDLFEFIVDSFMSMELNVSDFNLSILVFIVFSGSVFLFKICFWLFCWHSCYKGVHYKMLWIKRFSCLDNPVLMNSLWYVVIRYVAFFDLSVKFRILVCNDFLYRFLELS